MARNLGKIGRYSLKRSIGKGGMGEVFLAHDPVCDRLVALKRIRHEFQHKQVLCRRFLREARVSSQLSHPGIIPIYSIHSTGDTLYYTMPFVEGDTLKQVLRQARNLEKEGLSAENVGGSIPSLCRIFLNTCQAIAYSHNRGVLHRDIKPENVMVGKYGEVLILDWGLAKYLDEAPLPVEEGEDLEEEESLTDRGEITKAGRVVGTVSYMAPERALGEAATIQTDIYALGCTLYQILTLQNPFSRGSLQEFRQDPYGEELRDPTEVAPYRDVPRLLAAIVKKCLDPCPDDRYRTVDDIVHDLQTFIEGRSEWFPVCELKTSCTEDWGFQEHVLLADHAAITREAESTQWVHLQVSKESFSGNIRLEARVRISEEGQGIGFLMSVPEEPERTHAFEGYRLWLGTSENDPFRLLRSNVEVMVEPTVFLQKGRWYDVRIEKVENNIYLYINNTRRATYVTHRPLLGTHVGLMAPDGNFEIKPLRVSVGSLSIRVSCLDIPDSFLSEKMYDKALAEYRRISYSFPGSAEGRDAMFRAGITLLERAKDLQRCPQSQDYENLPLYFQQAMDEFEKLHSTPGAPLEYLGKALVYQALKEEEEELKCYELSFRKYQGHPLLPILKEQVVFRLHDSSRLHRMQAYRFSLMVIQNIPKEYESRQSRKLFINLTDHWEILTFVERVGDRNDELKRLHFAATLAFWLAKPYSIMECLQKLSLSDPFHHPTILNCVYFLFELGAANLALRYTSSRIPHVDNNQKVMAQRLGIFAALSSSKPAQLDALLAEQGKTIFEKEKRIFLGLLRWTALEKDLKGFDSILKRIPTHSGDSELTWLLVERALLGGNLERAQELLDQEGAEAWHGEKGHGFFLYGSLLAAREGKDAAMKHFSKVFESPFPRTWALGAHFLRWTENARDQFLRQAFLWEKRCMYQQLALFHHCCGERDLEEKFRTLALRQFMSIHDD